MSVWRARPSAEATLAYTLQIRVHHHRHEVAENDGRRPAELGSRLRRVALQERNLRRAVKPLVDDDVIAPIEARARERELGEFLHAVRFARGDDEILGLVLLHDELDGLHVVAGEAPIAAGLEVAERERLLAAGLDPRHRARDL